MRHLTRSEVVDLFADLVPRNDDLRPTAVALVQLLDLATPADPFDALAGSTQRDATRRIVAAIARRRGEQVCGRCGGTGQYGHHGVCFDCGGRRTVAAV